MMPEYCSQKERMHSACIGGRKLGIAEIRRLEADEAAGLPNSRPNKPALSAPTHCA